MSIPVVKRWALVNDGICLPETHSWWRYSWLLWALSADSTQLSVPLPMALAENSHIVRVIPPFQKSPCSMTLWLRIKRSNTLAELRKPLEGHLPSDPLNILTLHCNPSSSCFLLFSSSSGVDPKSTSQEASCTLIFVWLALWETDQWQRVKCSHSFQNLVL